MDGVAIEALMPNIMLSRRTMLVRALLVSAVAGSTSPFTLPHAHAAIMVVDTDAESGAGSLRDAIEQANTNAAADTISFAPSFNGGIYNIVLTTGELSVAADGGHALTIDAQDSDVTIDANSASRVFNVGSGANLTLTNLTITGGKADNGGGILTQDATLTVSNSRIIANVATGSGGGIDSFGGTLTLESNSTVSGNNAHFGGGIANANVGTATLTNSTVVGNNAATRGGGIWNNGTLTLVSSTVTGNGATSEGGGGLYNAFGPVILTASTVSDNNTGAFGGGIFNSGIGTIEMNGGQISGNSADDGGGGIDNFGGTVTLMDSTVAGNDTGAGFGGGGINNRNGGTATLAGSTVSGNTAMTEGGGIYNNGNLTLANSTVSGNAAPSGGGVFHAAFTSILINNTLTNNTATTGGGIFRGTLGTLTLTNTIVAGQALGGDCGGPASPSSGGHNLDSDATCKLTDLADIPNGNASLGPLQDNGGPTETHALLANSDAIDAGDETVCAASPVDGLDQRGFVRPGVGATNCSIGAYEFNAVPPTCGNGVVDPNETCGETMLPPCASGELCLDCACRQLGDCRNDGGVPNLFDVLEMVDVLLGRQMPDANQMILCDVDCDTQVDLFDALKAIDLVLGRIQQPLECP
jgi:hypothetical protein